jgi:hypothetical protein
MINHEFWAQEAFSQGVADYDARKPCPYDPVTEDILHCAWHEGWRFCHRVDRVPTWLQYCKLCPTRPHPLAQAWALHLMREGQCAAGAKAFHLPRSSSTRTRCRLPCMIMQKPLQR